MTTLGSIAVRPFVWFVSPNEVQSVEIYGVQTLATQYQESAAGSPAVAKIGVQRLSMPAGCTAVLDHVGYHLEYQTHN